MEVSFSVCENEKGSFWRINTKKPSMAVQNPIEIQAKRMPKTVTRAASTKVVPL